MENYRNLNIEFRPTFMGDAVELERWLADPSVLKAFSMFADSEFKEAATRWVYYSRYKSSLTAMRDGKMVGLTTLYLQPYERLRHQSEFGIIVAPECRGQGIGSKLLDELFKMAVNTFEVELLHLQVHEGNPAIDLYKRKGFVEFGRQAHFLKEPDGSYCGRIFMEKVLK